ncbi:MAG: ATP-dependent Clp protease proteolytic subunit 1 [Chlamydiia bacterium]|nr:ATP-dependent Clp protease proteolytic subunit 1 [Chlamydiia bacterium]
MYRLEDEEDEEESGVNLSVHRKVDELLLEHRRVFLSAPVDDKSANAVIRKLWYLELTDPGKPILFVINSPGGAVDSGFAIWDQIKLMTSPVTTLITGLAASMGSVLSLVAGKGKRFATPNSRIMIHQPSIHGVIRGQATDLEIHAREILKTRDSLIGLYVEATGKDAETIEKALDRDTWLSAQEALEFGLLDKIVDNPKDILLT